MLFLLYKNYTKITMKLSVPCVKLYKKIDTFDQYSIPSIAQA